jgi:hypothetical protein
MAGLACGPVYNADAGLKCPHASFNPKPQATASGRPYAPATPACAFGYGLNEGRINRPQHRHTVQVKRRTAQPWSVVDWLTTIESLWVPERTRD